MKFLVLGSGLMGPAAAYNIMSDPDVNRVVVVDLRRQRLDACINQLGKLNGARKLALKIHDINDQAATVELMKNFDVVLGALPQSLHFQGIRAAVQAGVPLVDIAYFNHPQWPQLKQEVDASGVLVLVGCGVEPGLTEIIARCLAEKLDRADQLHIKVGGITENPTPPMNYKIVFGGNLMPWSQSPATIVRDGKLTTVPRHSQAEPMTIPGVGICEAFHETFFPWMLNVPALANLKVATQKTVRWPGYAAKAILLMELGLLSLKPITVNGVEVVPKRVVDEVLYPHVKLEKGDKDITIFRVEIIGEKNGHRTKYQVDMVDRYDDVLGFTSMARTTAMTGAIIARMVGRGDLKAVGLLPPEQVIIGPLFDRLINDLAASNIKFDITSEKIENLTNTI